MGQRSLRSRVQAAVGTREGQEGPRAPRGGGGERQGSAAGSTRVSAVGLGEAQLDVVEGAGNERSEVIRLDHFVDNCRFKNGSEQVFRYAGDLVEDFHVEFCRPSEVSSRQTGRLRILLENSIREPTVRHRCRDLRPEANSARDGRARRLARVRVLAAKSGLPGGSLDGPRVFAREAVDEWRACRDDQFRRLARAAAVDRILSADFGSRQRSPGCK